MKKRRRVLALFISIFLRNRSLSDARWFYGQKRKIGMVNLYLTENRLSWNEMCCASDNHNYMCHTCAKEFLIRALIKQLLKKYQICPILPQISHFHKKRFFFFKYICKLFRPTASLYKFYGRDMSGILFFSFASCEPLSYIKFVFHLLKNAVCNMTWLASFHVCLSSVFCTELTSVSWYLLVVILLFSL